MKLFLNRMLLFIVFCSTNPQEICGQTLKSKPIGFAIPESKIVLEIPQKDLDFAPLIPGVSNTYIYEDEESYYRDYQRSFFAVTSKKGGWDCLRHYEILANGCIPYFLDLDSCPEDTLTFFPKELIQEAMNMEGVSYLHIDHKRFDYAKYEQILKKLLAHTHQFLTTQQMADYLLKSLNYSGKGKILFLCNDYSQSKIDYLSSLLLIGLKELLHEKIIDVPKMAHIYKNFAENVRMLPGKGITYTRNLEDLPINRDEIEQRIVNKEFELIIYATIHRAALFYHLALENYESERIAYVCGEDWHACKYGHLRNFFLRESEAYFPKLKMVPNPTKPDIRFCER